MSGVGAFGEHDFGEHLVVTASSPVAEICFNRPEKKNAFVSFDMVKPLRAAFDFLDEQDDVKVIVFRGAGDDFSTGGDVSAIGHMYNDDGDATEANGPRKRPTQRRHLRIDGDVYKVWEAIAHSSKVIIAEGKGYVLGVALDWFLAADLVICAEDTKLGYPPGRMVGYGGLNPLFWLTKMGPALHAEMTLMGRYIGAQEAYDRGVISKVVAREQLEAVVSAAAEAVCCVPADGLAIGKLSRRIAFEALGAGVSGLQSVLGHSMAVQSRVSPDEWSLNKRREALGPRDAWRERDARFKSALNTFENGAPNG